MLMLYVNIYKIETKLDTNKIFKIVKRKQNKRRKGNNYVIKRGYFFVLLKLKIPKLFTLFVKIVFYFCADVFLTCEY